MVTTAKRTQNTGALAQHVICLERWKQSSPSPFLAYRGQGKWLMGDEVGKVETGLDHR